MAEIRFPIWFYYGFLEHMGWPRSKGFIKKRNFVDATIADATLKQLLTMGHTIGAGSPELSSRLVADVFQGRDWAAPLDELNEILDAQHSPLQEMSFGSPGAEVPWDALATADVSTQIAAAFACAIWFGAKNSGQIIQAADDDLAGSRERGAEHLKHGLDIDPGSLAESYSDQLAQAILAVEDFEGEAGTLDEAPPELVRFMSQFRSTGAA